MNAQEYLSEVKKLNRQILNKRIEVAQWRALAKGLGSYSEGERVQSSGNLQKMETAVCEYTDIEAEIVKDVIELERKKQEIIKKIQQLPVKEYNVLHMLYIQYKGDNPEEGYTLYDVADYYDKSYSWATSKHGKALKSLQAILDSEEV